MSPKSMIRIALVSSLVLASTFLGAQTRKIYTTSGNELIFSVPTGTVLGREASGPVRFSPVFNFQNLVHYDVSPHFGYFSGLSFRNVGFIYDVPDSDQRKKARTYSVGIPAGIKVGQMNGFLFFGGYELEIPIHYKEKLFVDGDRRDRFGVWFSNRTPLQHALMAGVQWPHGVSVKFKYYLTSFYNRSFTERPGGVPQRPYQDIDVNMFYFSLNFNLFRNTEFYHHRGTVSRD